MIEGVVLGVLTWLGFFMTWFHMPSIIKLQTKKHPILSDLITGYLAFFFLTSISKSLTAVTAGIVTGLLTDLALHASRWSETK
jgi:hypothetical protein